MKNLSVEFPSGFVHGIGFFCCADLMFYSNELRLYVSPQLGIKFKGLESGRAAAATTAQCGRSPRTRLLSPPSSPPHRLGFAIKVGQ